MPITSKAKKPKPKPKPTILQRIKKFNHDISLFSGELGLTKEDIEIIGSLLHHISNDEISRLAIFDSKLFATKSTNLYRVKYKLEAMLHGKSK